MDSTGSSFSSKYLPPEVHCPSALDAALQAGDLALELLRTRLNRLWFRKVLKLFQLPKLTLRIRTWP